MPELYIDKLLREPIEPMPELEFDELIDWRRYPLPEESAAAVQHRRRSTP